jgi:hypothetical protein
MKVNHEWTRIQNRFYLYRLLYIRGSLFMDTRRRIAQERVPTT